MSMTGAGIARFAERFESIFTSAHNRNAARRYAAEARGEVIDPADLEPEDEPEVAYREMDMDLTDTVEAQSIDADEVAEEIEDADEAINEWAESAKPQVAKSAYNERLGCFVEVISDTPTTKALSGWNPILGCHVGFTTSDEEA